MWICGQFVTNYPQDINRHESVNIKTSCHLSTYPQQPTTTTTKIKYIYNNNRIITQEWITHENHM